MKVKRLICLIITAAMVFGMIQTAVAVDENVYKTYSGEINESTQWSYLDDNTDPAGDSNAEEYRRTSWTLTEFDDSEWKTASGSFGSKRNENTNGADNMLAGCDGAANYTTYFFRTKVNIENAAAVTKIIGSIKYDDAVIIYINGIRAAAFNADNCTSNMSYSNGKADTTSNIEVTDPEVIGALQNGINTVAVELHNDSADSSDIYFGMESLKFSTEKLPTANILINSETQWKYSDSKTDPAGDSSAAGYDRTSWTLEDFDDSMWKEAAGPFGSKKGSANLEIGYTANTVLDGCNGTDDTPAYFFRTKFNVDSLENMTKLKCTIQYDDGAVVYINGKRVAAFDDNACDASGNSMGHGFDSNLQYGGSNAGTPKTASFSILELSILNEGENTIAVELHNGRQTSSDIWFSMIELSLSDESVKCYSNISLSVGANESQMNFTWYSPFDLPGTLTFAKQSEIFDGKMPENADSVTADITQSNKVGYYSNQASIDNLEGDTLYAYQISNGSIKSEIYTFKTGGSGDFSFAYVGDPQIGAGGNVENDTYGWERTLQKISTDLNFSDISFLLSAGDQVNTASSEEEYDGYLEHEALNSLPVATVIGNHDSGSEAYGQHFNVPNESSEYGATTAGSDYYFVYNKVLFMVLNSNNKSVAEHKAFMEGAIEATRDEDIQWKIVSFHHSIYTVASHANDSYITDPIGFKNSIAPIFKELDIDVVLQGHDHVYCRTYIMDGLTPITESEKYVYGNGEDQAPTAVTDPDGVLYITANSGSGSKTYNILNQEFPFSAVKNQEHIPNLSKIEVNDSRFTITTYRTTDMSIVDSFTINRAAEKAPKLIIDQVYGGGGKGETPIKNSFIEIYNPNDEDVSLAGCSINYDGNVLPLDKSKSIPAHGSYLIVGGSEATTDDFVTYELPEVDQTCDWIINNKKYTITLENNGAETDSITADSDIEAVKISKQKSLQRIEHQDTDTNDDFRIVVWEKESMTVSGDTLSKYAPHNSKGEYGSLKKRETETEKPEVNLNTKSDKDVLKYLGSYSTGYTNKDGGVAEIVKFNSDNGCMYIVSGQTQTLDIVKIGSKGETTKVKSVDVAALGEANGFSAGDITSVDVNTKRDIVAIAVQNSDYSKDGTIALLDYDGNFVDKYSSGNQPDMITFTPDGRYILTANEGEPRNGYVGDAVDPEGSVTIVDLEMKKTNNVTFESEDENRSKLIENGVLIRKDTTPSADLEPEYIAVSSDSKTAYVTLQENNAVAALDIENGVWKYIKGLGFKNHNLDGNGLDIDADGKADIKNENVYGVYMPDGIAYVKVSGKEYLITANEGDAREWGDYQNVDSAALVLSDGEQAGKKIEYLINETTDGLDADKTYILGGRSFSIWAADTLEQIYDSGDEFEKKTAEIFPEYFNSAHDGAGVIDKRSNKKGPEPESVAAVTVNKKTYAVVGLERIGGIMLYDISNPKNPNYADYLNVRDFAIDDLAFAGDLGAEGICTILPTESPTSNAMILIANEISGTVTLAQIPVKKSSSGISGGVKPDSPSEVIIPTDNDKDDDKDDDKNDDAPKPEDEKNHFDDVNEDDWFFDDILAINKKGLMKGISDGKFAPNDSTTRAMIVMILYRLAGEPDVKDTNPFSDVEKGSYYEDAVVWAKECGIVKGVSDVSFAPDQKVTREQLATFVYRYAQWKKLDVSNEKDLSSFNDKPDDWAVSAVKWCVGNEIVSGMGNGTIAPRENATRAQMAAILNRFISVFGIE